MAVLVSAMILGSVTALIGFALFLIFCASIVVRTGGSVGVAFTLAELVLVLITAVLIVAAGRTPRMRSS
jgi:hypothetical protein